MDSKDDKDGAMYFKEYSPVFEFFTTTLAPDNLWPLSLRFFINPTKYCAILSVAITMLLCESRP